MSSGQDEPTLLIEFLNTIDVELGTDQLDDPGDFEVWARSHGVVPGDRRRARRVRDALRNGLQGGGPSSVDLTLPVRVDGQGPHAAPRDVAEAVVAMALDLAATGQWARVKLCPADECLEAFFDRSRNRSRVWCDMADCGNRTKVRRYRTRDPGQSRQAADAALP